jgi:hypothetical protein
MNHDVYDEPIEAQKIREAHKLREDREDREAWFTAAKFVYL